VGLNTLKSLNLTNVYPNNKKNTNNNNKVKSKPLRASLAGKNLSRLWVRKRFLAASTECYAGSNDHFVVVVVPSLVQFDGRPLGGATFQY
jgi:hypothetical protein